MPSPSGDTIEVAMRPPATPSHQLTVNLIGNDDTMTIDSGKTQEEALECSIPTTAKRGIPFSFNASPLPRLSQRPRASNLDTALGLEKIEMAHQLIIEACPLLKGDRKEQERSLELLTLFRAFAERQTLPTTSAKLEKQVHTLENAVTKLTKLTKSTPTTTTLLPDQLHTQPKSYATVLLGTPSQGGTQAPTVGPQTASQRGPPTLAPLQTPWTTVQRKTNKPRTQGPCRLVLEIGNKDASIDALSLRDKVNETLKGSGFRDLAALSINKSVKGNLVITFANEAAKNYTLNRIDILQPIIPITKVLEDNT